MITDQKLIEAGHNPDSQCWVCCERIEELHFKLIPLLNKIDEKVNSLDVDKITGMVDKLTSNSLLKMLMK